MWSGCAGVPCGHTTPCLAYERVRVIRGLFLVAVLLTACGEGDGPQISERCRGFIEADAEARAEWERARDSGAPQEEVRRLRIAFGYRHQALFASGCLLS